MHQNDRYSCSPQHVHEIIGCLGSTTHNPILVSRWFCLVDSFHVVVIVVIVVVEVGKLVHIVVIILVIICVDSEAEFDETVDAIGKDGRLLEGES